MIHCPHFNECSGCTLDQGFENPPIYQEALSYFEKVTKIKPTYFYTSPFASRYKAKLAVRGTSKNPLIGLFKKGTHDVVDIKSCRVHHPLINEAILEVKEAIIDLNITPYNEKKGLGSIRYVQFHVHEKSQSIQLAIITNEKEEALKLLKSLKMKKPRLWHSLWINLNQAQTNRILGDEWFFVDGSLEFADERLNLSLFYSPATFAQANPNLFSQLVKEIMNTVDEKSKVVEYYSGIGAIGAPLSTKCQFVSLIEYTKEAKEMFEKIGRPNCAFFVGPVHDFLQLVDEHEVVIVDPPRKGLDSQLLQKLCMVDADKKLIYVSCGFDSFKRDCDDLLKSGWIVTGVSLYLLFPGSNHIETLAFFSKISV